MNTKQVEFEVFIAELEILKTERETLITQREGMIAENMIREMQGLAIAWGEEHFNQIEREFEAIVTKMQTLKKGSE